MSQIVVGDIKLILEMQISTRGIYNLSKYCISAKWFIRLYYGRLINSIFNTEFYSDQTLLSDTICRQRQ